MKEGGEIRLLFDVIENCTSYDIKNATRGSQCGKDELCRRSDWP